MSAAQLILTGHLVDRAGKLSFEDGTEQECVVLRLGGILVGDGTPIEVQVAMTPEAAHVIAQDLVQETASSTENSTTDTDKETTS